LENGVISGSEVPLNSFATLPTDEVWVLTVGDSRAASSSSRVWVLLLPGMGSWTWQSRTCSAISRLNTIGRRGQSILGSSSAGAVENSICAPLFCSGSMARLRAAASSRVRSPSRMIGVDPAIEAQVLSFRLKARPSSCATASRWLSGQARRIKVKVAAIGGVRVLPPYFPRRRQCQF
jgi:hypothetical protein